VRSAGWDTDGNIRVEIICARDVAERLAAHLQAKYYANFAMVCYLAQVEVLRPEKFQAARRGAPPDASPCGPVRAPVASPVAAARTDPGAAPGPGRVGNRSPGLSAGGQPPASDR